MKLVIAGSRNCTDYREVAKAVADFIEATGNVITEVVSGCARGADKLGEIWARKHGIPIKHFHANWDAYGKRAGHLRNAEMAEYGDALVALWNGDKEGSGTWNMIEQMTRQGTKYVWVHRIK